MAMVTASWSKDYQKMYQQWFNYVDSDGDGRITDDEAKKFFGMANIGNNQLKQLILRQRLKRLYKEKLKPLEVAYRYNDFASPLLTDGDFDVKPMVMLLGPCSSGKTTFIKHLLKCEYPGSYIGPGPTTDEFILVMDGHDKRIVSGQTIALQEDMPFNQLIPFGETFLSKFECSQMPHPLLERITFVDTPGVLSGEKQCTNRSYDINGVFKWFAEKCDLILLVFDPHKPGISEEFRRLLSSLHGQYEKMHVVLTKADQVDTQQLLRAYGTLMWLLGKNTPEVTRAYIGSFNDKPINEASVGFMGKDLFEKEQDELFKKLIGLPKEACSHLIKKIYKRARAAKMHAYIINQLKKEMPANDIMGKTWAQRKLMWDLERVFTQVQMEYHLPACDFPDVEHFRKALDDAYSLDKFEKLKPRMIQAVDDMLQFDIPNLFKSQEI